MHTTEFDKSWKSLQSKQKHQGVGLLAAVTLTLLVVSAFAGAVVFDLPQPQVFGLKCDNRTEQRLISETHFKDGSVECRYVRDVTGLAVEKVKK